MLQILANSINSRSLRYDEGCERQRRCSWVRNWVQQSVTSNQLSTQSPAKSSPASVYTLPSLCYQVEGSDRRKTLILFSTIHTSSSTNERTTKGLVPIHSLPYKHLRDEESISTDAGELFEVALILREFRRSTDQTRERRFDAMPS
jgi:hypothetical protein